jgi:hypothetical protein
MDEAKEREVEAWEKVVAKMVEEAMVVAKMEEEEVVVVTVAG